MPRTYTVHWDGSKTTYVGFNHAFDHEETMDIVLFLVEGEIEVWAIDGPAAIDELMRYYYGVYGWYPELIGQFRRVECRG